MITPESENHSKYIEKQTDIEYDILTDNLDLGESIQCQDDPDMVITKDHDGEILLVKKCYLKMPFSS